ncbi:MAG: sulfotransferase family 2 domain-containing protein [Cyclobacteriaceae bacterium]
MISRKHKCIFVHVPKCAGTSVEAALHGCPISWFDHLNGIWIQHATASQLKNIYLTQDGDENDWDDFFKFTIVRNPYDRLVSSYNWLCINERIPKSKRSFRRFLEILLMHLGLMKPRTATFKDFLSKSGAFRILLNSNDISFANRFHQIRPAVDYIMIDNKIAVDRVIRFENISIGWQEVCQRLDINMALPHLLKEGNKSYSEYYDNYSKALVKDLYKKDLETFDYVF